jgi:predicted DCC family thiol-disulfide oxidoreductase YuxK
MIRHAAEEIAAPTASRHYGYHRTLIYDGECAFCRRSVGLLRKWDHYGRIRYVMLQDAVSLHRLPPIPREDLERAMHLVAPSGEIFSGADALRALLPVLKWGRAAAAIFNVPGVPALARRIYAIVARNRHRLNCGSSTCTLGK